MHLEIQAILKPKKDRISKQLSINTKPKGSSSKKIQNSALLINRIVDFDIVKKKLKVNKVTSKFKNTPFYDTSI